MKEVVHVSQLENPEIPPKFSIIESFTSKDSGLYLHVKSETDDFDNENTSQLLIHISRSSVNKTKDTKAIYLSSKELFVC